MSFELEQNPHSFQAYMDIPYSITDKKYISTKKSENLISLF